MNSTVDLPDTVRESRAFRVLERALAGDRLAHGILLHGENLAVLERTVAVIAARLLETGGDALAHPDCFIVRPKGKARIISVGSDADKVAGEWPANSMRRLISDLHKSASQGTRKVGVVFEADRMNQQSANAFLKTLEEPAPGTTLFLITTRRYDLLPTVRSRCLEFHLPATGDPVGGEDWENWRLDYQSWLASLVRGPQGRDGVADLLFAAYGLNSRFQAILDGLAAADWKHHRGTLPDGLGDAEKVAIETGIRKGIRRRLYVEIEKATVAYGRELGADADRDLPVHAIHAAVDALEQSAGLLELNFNDLNALELFLLKSLRIWTSAAKGG